jgi:hypothetical protein
MRAVLSLTVAAFAVGCALTYDVVTIGDDTYETSTVAARVHGGISGAQRMAIANANKLGQEVRQHGQEHQRYQH